ncbi:hypothetical protein [Pseudomonas sp. NUPR-001]|uniref:hypothetical protein n=1 Tax=Pseudomonas sp. NUPR-001 TaxID=3416058 RepID=UPI003F9CD349
MFKLDFTNGTLQWTPQAIAGVDVSVRLFFGLTLNEWFYVTVIMATFVQMWAVIYKTRKGSPKDKE